MLFRGTMRTDPQPSSESLGAVVNSDWSPGFSTFNWGAFLGGFSVDADAFLMKKNTAAAAVTAAPIPIHQICFFFIPYFFWSY